MNKSFCIATMHSMILIGMLLLFLIAESSSAQTYSTKNTCNPLLKRWVPNLANSNPKKALLQEADFNSHRTGAFSCTIISGLDAAPEVISTYDNNEINWSVIKQALPIHPLLNLFDANTASVEGNPA